MSIVIHCIEYQSPVSIHHHLDHQMADCHIIAYSRKFMNLFFFESIESVQYSTSNVIFVGEELCQVH